MGQMIRWCCDDSPSRRVCSAGQRIRKHAESTQSTLARKILANWDHMHLKFVKVMPRDYKRAVAAMKRAEAEGIPWEKAVMEGAHG